MNLRPLCSVETYNHKSLAGTIPVTSHTHTLARTFSRSLTHTFAMERKLEPSEQTPKTSGKRTKDGRKRALERMLIFGYKLTSPREVETLFGWEFWDSLSPGLSWLPGFLIHSLNLNVVWLPAVVVAENSPLSVFTVIWTRAEQLSELGGGWAGWYLVIQKPPLSIKPARHSGDR